MATAVTMPRLGLTMAEGTVVEWHARVGEMVSQGAVLLDIESEKAEVEVEAFASGVLAAVYVEPGTTVPVGTLLGAIAAPGESFDAAAFRAAFVPEVAGTPATGHARETAGSPPAVSSTTSGPAAAPAARAAARRLGLDLRAVTGTGPGGRITVEDVDKAAAAVVRVNGTGLAVDIAGSGSPVLFINGYGVDASGWRRQIDGLASAHTVITYDHRGIGGSWPIREAVSIAQLAEDADALLTHLGHRPAVIVGASLGAAVALELALAHPEAVRALVLVTPIVARDARFEAVLQSWREHETPAAESRIRAMLPWLLGRDFLAHAGRREAAAAALRAMAPHTPAEALRRHADALLAWLRTRMDALGRIDVPAVLVAGADDVLTPPAHAEAIAAGLPDARLEVLPGAGHAVMIERADALNALIADVAGRWLREPAS